MLNETLVCFHSLQTAAELEALPPAVLDQAFQGEL